MPYTVGMRRIILSLVVLASLGGVAAADRGGPYVRDHRGGTYVQPHARAQPRARYEYRQRYTHRPRYTNSSRYVVRPSYRYTRPAYRYVRRPIYVQRPVIAVRYYNYAQRPALIAESYPPMAGYYWVPGHWDWNGYEWIWNPGHYEPEVQGHSHPEYSPQYQQQYQSYDDGYDNY